MVDAHEAIMEDSYMLAAMITLDPDLTWAPQPISVDRFGFRVKGGIADAMGRFLKGETAPLQLYCANLKMLRAAIFASRQKQVRSRRT